MATAVAPQRMPSWALQAADLLPSNVPLLAQTSSVLITSQRCVMRSYSLLDVSGSGSHGYLVNGDVDNGDIVAAFGAGASLDATRVFGDNGLPCTRGLFLVILSGSVTGAVWFQG